MKLDHERWLWAFGPMILGGGGLLALSIPLGPWLAGTFSLSLFWLGFWLRHPGFLLSSAPLLGILGGMVSAEQMTSLLGPDIRYGMFFLTFALIWLLIGISSEWRLGQHIWWARLPSSLLALTGLLVLSQQGVWGGFRLGALAVVASLLLIGGFRVWQMGVMPLQIKRGE